MDQKRYMDGALVDEVAVGCFAVIAEAFPVIGEHDYERFIPPAVLDQCRAEAAEHLVDVCQFGVVAFCVRH